jgi:hypothetical protein
MSTVKAVNLRAFDDRARLMLSEARRAAQTGAGVLDSGVLLAALLDDATLWPFPVDFPLDVVRQLTRRERAVLETRGEAEFEGVPLTREVEVVLQTATEIAAGPVHVEHLLLALADGGGSEASVILRQATEHADPWTMVRVHCWHQLEVARRAAGDDASPARERVVALLYLLARDEVPFGKLTAMIEDLTAHKTFRFTNAEAERLAAGLADRLWA